MGIIILRTAEDAKSDHDFFDFDAAAISPELTDRDCVGDVVVKYESAHPMDLWGSAPLAVEPGWVDWCCPPVGTRSMDNHGLPLQSAEVG